MKQQFSTVALVAMLIGAFLSLSPTASALRCYECQSSDGWSDCHSRAIEVTCGTVSQVSILDKTIFLPPQPRQLEPACLGLSAEGSIGGTKGYAYLRQCFFNDKSLCSAVQAELPPGFRVLTCDLCTTELCNGASSVTIAFSSLVMVAVAILLRK